MSLNNMHELSILVAETHFVIEIEARMKIKKSGIQSEASELFGLNNSLEMLQTKNVIEASVLVPPLPFGQQKRERVSRSRFLICRSGLNFSFAWCASAISPQESWIKSQFFVLSTRAPFLIHGIMSRSLTPTSSIGCWASLARVALNEVWLTLFSSIQSRANLPA